MRVRVAVASPESIRRRSSGVVVSPEDLFDSRIFGPPGAGRFGHLELAHRCRHPARRGLKPLEVLPIPPPELRPAGSERDAAYRALLAARVSPGALQRALDALFRLLARPRPADLGPLHPVVPDPGLGLDQCALPEPLTGFAGRAVLLFAPGAGVLACEPVEGGPGALRLHPLALSELGLSFGEATLATHPCRAEDARALRPSRLLLSPVDGRARIALRDELALACWRLTWLHPAEAERSELRAFASPAEALVALELGEVAPGERIAVRGRRTTPGRLAFEAMLPAELRPVEEPMTRIRLRERLERCHAQLGPDAAAAMLEALTRLASAWATRFAFTLGKDDLAPPLDRPTLLAEAAADVAAINTQYEEGLITDGERYNKVVDIWSIAAERVGAASVREREAAWLAGRADLLITGRDAGALRPDAARRLAGMVGLASKPSGEIHEVPVLASRAEGLGAGDYFRTASRDAALLERDRRRRASQLRHLLARRLGGVQVTAEDCGDRRGVRVTEVSGSGWPLVSLDRRVEGHVVLEPGQVSARVRSPLACRASEGVCAACYGRNPATGLPARVGERVGLLAALALTSELTRFGRRTFHIGCGSRVASDAVTRTGGDVRVEGLLLTRRDGAQVFADARGAVEVGGERQELPLGAVLRVAAGARVEAGAQLAEWDPWSRPLLSPVAGRVALRGGQLAERVDEVTGLTRREVQRPGKLEVGGVALALEVGAQLCVSDGDEVGRGEVLARHPLAQAGLGPLELGDGDDVLALERLLRLRRPANPARLAPAAGRVERAKGRLRILGPEGVRAEVQVPPGVWVSVQDGQAVERGETLTFGAYDAHQVLALLGREVLAGQWVDALLELFALQGLALAPAHAELAAARLLPVGPEIEG